MTRQPITTRAKSARGARDLARPPGPVQLAAPRQGKLHDVAPGLPVQLEARFCSGEQVSVATDAHATGQTGRRREIRTSDLPPNFAPFRARQFRSIPAKQQEKYVVWLFRALSPPRDARLSTMSLTTSSWAGDDWMSRGPMGRVVANVKLVLVHSR